MPKKSKAGQLILRRAGYSARYRTMVDGEWVRVCTPLGTTNKAVARIKLERLLSGEAKPENIGAVETFEQAARRIVPTQGIVSVDERMSRLQRFAFPEFGQKPVTEVRAADIKGALEVMIEAGRARASVAHLLKDIKSVMRDLWESELLAENPCDRVRIPDSAKVDRRKRVILTDLELEQLLAWPKLRKDLAVMCVIARCVGGMRTSDLHAWDWAHIDTQNWKEARIPRPKTKTFSQLILPEVAIPTLRDWWDYCEKPTAGPVFPIQQGAQAGKRRGRISHASRLRAALWSAGVRRGETKETCPLQTHTDASKRTDFHSFRRVYNTALAKAGVNVQTAMKLAGHASPQVHMMYVQLTEATETPESALPRALSVPMLSETAMLNYHNRTQNRIGDICQSSGLNAQNSSVLVLPNPKGWSSEPRCPGTVPTDRAADAAIQAYLRELADGLAAREVAS